MHNYDANTHLTIQRLESARVAKRAELRASLGPTPQPEPLRPFSRKVVHLRDVVELRRGSRAEGPLTAA